MVVLHYNNSSELVQISFVRVKYKNVQNYEVSYTTFLYRIWRIKDKGTNVSAAPVDIKRPSLLNLELYPSISVKK